MRDGRAPSSIKDLVVTAIKLVVRQVGVTLSHGDIPMTGQLLGEFEVAAGRPEDGGDEIVAEGMRGYGLSGRIAKCVTDTFVYDRPAGRGRNWEGLLSSPKVVSREEREGGKRW